MDERLYHEVCKLAKGVYGLEPEDVAAHALYRQRNNPYRGDRGEFGAYAANAYKHALHDLLRGKKEVPTATLTEPKVRKAAPECDGLRFTKRQIETAQEVVDSYSQAKAAKVGYRSEGGVEWHMMNLRKKLGVNTTFEVIIRLAGMGLIKIKGLVPER